ncbi:hypothetical protein CARUB_v10008821mg [Capsella rubella]|uniref:Translation initiation factor 3 N-terminal domain-containing protein n=1 Tax=Capsella rubella TaxID=81985 RepID=R0ICC6_9BRAS|nr:translation initiation factor IF3-1, mitochondrial [Capsella rubella]EOA40119.1 hypothetical protein CARUB_v10008821mg [Capsella rubella]
MAVWRIINRSYLKYASNQLTRRSYTQVCLASSNSLTHAVKQTTSKVSFFDIPNSDICTRPSNVFQNLRFLATSAQTRKKEEEVESDGPRLNEKITGEYVRLVSEEGHCVVSLKEALRRAKEAECDLVEVQRDAKPPVCKIVKYTLEKYKKAKVGKERAKAKRAEAIRPEVKEIRFTPKIEAKDLKFKSDQALKLMENGYRVKCNAVPDKDKHKELEPEKLLELLFRFTCYLGDALVEFGPEADRKSAVVIVRHAKFGPPKKGGAKKLKDLDIKSARVKESAKPDSLEAGESSVDDQGDIENSEPGISVHQAQPVHVQNTYAKREPSSEFSGGRDTSRFESRSPNQHVNPQRPPFPNQAPNQQPTGRFNPQSPNQPPSAPRPQFPNQAQNQQPTGRFNPQFPNQPPSAPRPQSSNQAPNQQPTGRFDPQFPNQPPSPPRPRFPDQAPNQQQSGPSPNRHPDRQGPPPRFQNQAPNQQPPSRFEPQPPNPPRAPPRPQPRLPNETPNQQQPTTPGRSSGPASGYGIFSTPKTK